MSRTVPVPNPVEGSYTTSPPHVSSKTFHIAGILTTVFGLDELLSNATQTACLWLLHPRLLSQECMQPFAASSIAHWNTCVRERIDGQGRKQDPSASLQPLAKKEIKGLIAVAFDQRNHGSREVDKLANEAWRGGNPRHAQDMFSQIHGTAADTSILLDYLAAYVFPDNAVQITQNIMFGVSLGGYAAWQVLLREPRITTGIVGIGCADYIRMMVDRARLSKLADWNADNPSDFLNSKSFTQSLVVAVKKHDPAGLIMGAVESVSNSEHVWEPSAEEEDKVSKILDHTLHGKRILVLSGGVDKLVPYTCSEPFLTFLKHAIKTYYSHGGIVLRDCVFDEIGHDISPGMVTELHGFIEDSMEAREGSPDPRRGRATSDSKI